MLALFLMHVIIGRKLSPDNYGLFSFILSIVAIFVLIANMGWTTVLVKLVPHYMIKEEWSLLKGLLFRSHQMTIGISVLLCATLIIVSFLISDPDKSKAYYYAAWLLPVISLTRLRQVLFQGLYHVKGSILPDEVFTPFLVVVCLLVLNAKNINAVISIYFSILVLVLAVTMVWLWVLLPKEMKPASMECETAVWFKLAVPFVIGGLAQVILSQCGVFLLGMFGQMKDAGLFSVAFRLALFITFAMTAINVIGMPMLSAHFNNNDLPSVIMIHKKTQLWSILGGLPVFLVLILFPERILSLFGKGFEEAAITLKILSVGQLANISVGLAGSLLSVAGAERFNMMSMISSMTICLLLMLITMPVYGSLGAACSYSCGLVLLSGMQLYKTNQILRTK